MGNWEYGLIANIIFLIHQLEFATLASCVKVGEIVVHRFIFGNLSVITSGGDEI